MGLCAASSVTRSLIGFSILILGHLPLGGGDHLAQGVPRFVAHVRVAVDSRAIEVEAGRLAGIHDGTCIPRTARAMAQSAKASAKPSSAAVIVSPWLMQPGASAALAMKPPSSVSRST